MVLRILDFIFVYKLRSLKRSDIIHIKKTTNSKKIIQNWFNLTRPKPPRANWLKLALRTHKTRSKKHLALLTTSLCPRHTQARDKQITLPTKPTLDFKHPLTNLLFKSLVEDRVEIVGEMRFKFFLDTKLDPIWKLRERFLNKRQKSKGVVKVHKTKLFRKLRYRPSRRRFINRYFKFKRIKPLLRIVSGNMLHKSSKTSSFKSFTKRHKKQLQRNRRHKTNPSPAYKTSVHWQITDLPKALRRNKLKYLVKSPSKKINSKSLRTTARLGFLSTTTPLTPKAKYRNILKVTSHQIRTRGGVKKFRKTKRKLKSLSKRPSHAEFIRKLRSRFLLQVGKVYGSLHKSRVYLRGNYSINRLTPKQRDISKQSPTKNPTKPSLFRLRVLSRSKRKYTRRINRLQFHKSRLHLATKVPGSNLYTKSDLNISKSQVRLRFKIRQRRKRRYAHNQLQLFKKFKRLTTHRWRNKLRKKNRVSLYKRWFRAKTTLRNFSLLRKKRRRGKYQKVVNVKPYKLGLVRARQLHGKLLSSIRLRRQRLPLRLRKWSGRKPYTFMNSKIYFKNKQTFLHTLVKLFTVRRRRHLVKNFIFRNRRKKTNFVKTRKLGHSLWKVKRRIRKIHRSRGRFVHPNLLRYKDHLTNLLNINRSKSLNPKNLIHRNSVFASLIPVNRNFKPKLRAQFYLKNTLTQLKKPKLRYSLSYATTTNLKNQSHILLSGFKHSPRSVTPNYVKRNVMVSYSVGTFSLSNSSFYTLYKRITYRTRVNSVDNYKYLWTFKKKAFSFIYPNDLSKEFMNSKRRSMSFSLIRSLASESRKLIKRNFRLNYWTTKSSRLGKYRSLSRFFTNSNFYSNFSSSLLNTTKSLPSDFNYSLRPNVLRDEYMYKNYSRKGEVLTSPRIQRLKFKPGYQRVWRIIRSAFRDVWNLKFRYEQRLTKFMYAFSVKDKIWSFRNLDMALYKTIAYTGILPDYTTIDSFINGGLIYVNGYAVTNKRFILTRNDFIQFEISNWFYVYSRWLVSWTNTHMKKYRRLVYKKSLAYKHTDMKVRKQKSYYIPRWIHFVKIDEMDTKSYLEVDYFTLSAFVVYDPFIFSSVMVNNQLLQRGNIYRLYNWKHIT